MRPPRFRLRTLLVAVAVAAIIWEGVRLRRWRARCLERAGYHGQMRQYRQWAASLIADGQCRRPGLISSLTLFVMLDGTPVVVSSGAIHYRERALSPDKPADRSAIGRLAERCRWEAAYHDRMRQKWERAARYPWLPVAPDSPPPK